MWPGFDTRTRRRMSVVNEFVVGTRPCSEKVFSGYSDFPFSTKTDVSKFKFDLLNVQQLVPCTETSNTIKTPFHFTFGNLRVRFFGKIRKRICDLRSFESCRIKGTDESLSRVDSSVPLMWHDPNDLRSQIRFRILPNAPLICSLGTKALTKSLPRLRNYNG